METVQQVADASLQDITKNNPVPNLNASPLVKPVDDLTTWEAKRKREAATTNGDYVSAALHQDDFLNGFIANHVGEQMTTDPTFNILKPDVWDHYTKDLPDSLKGEMLDARSPAHAEYTRSLLADKMHEQSILGDLGWKGNTLRMIGGFVEPGNLLTMAGTMGIGSVVGGGTAIVRATKALQLTTEMAAGPAKVAAVAQATRELQTAAKAASGVTQGLTDVGAAAGINAGLEKVRQEFNFEHDDEGVIHAGLMGTILGAPFAALHMRQMARVRESAGAELAMLNHIQAGDVTKAPVEQVREMHNHVADVLTGEKEIGDLKEPQSVTEAEHVASTPRDKADPYAGEELAPEGFVPGSVGSAAVSSIPSSAGVEPTYMRNGRLDIYATLNRSENKTFQELGHILVKDPIANSRVNAQSWSASEIKRNVQRTLGGLFHTEAQAAVTDAIKTAGVPLGDRRAFAREFYENVSRVTRGDTTVLQQNPTIAPMLQRAAKAQQSVYQKMLERMQKAGVKGAEHVTPNDTYVNRVFNFGKIRDLIAKHGEANVHALLDNAMVRTPGSSATAAKYLAAVRKLEFSHSQDFMMHAHDAGTLRSELSRAGLTPAEIDSIVDTMFEAKQGANSDAGQAGSLKYRFKMDENYGQRMPDGSTLKVSDLFENDSRVLVDKYLNSMAGHTALAEKGIKSRADFQGWLTDAENAHIASPGDVGRYNRDKQLMEDMYDHITGRPMSTQSFNMTDRMANSLRAFTRSAVLGQLGVAAAFELHKAVVMAGMRSAITQLPTLRSTLAAVRKGHQFDSDLARDIRTLWGFGSESAAAHAREHEISDFAYDRGLSKFENFTNEASHVVDHLSGNAFFTAATREMSTRFMIQKYADFASGARTMTPKLRERMVGSGTDASMIDATLRDLNKHVERQDGRVTHIRYEDWQAQSPITFENFQRAVERDTRDAIQEHDIGETMPWMHSTLGKVFSELRTFMLVGHAKSALKALHYRDATSANQLMFGVVSEALAYSLQTSMNFAGNQKELQRRLAPDYMAKSIFQRMSLFGAAPGMIDTFIAKPLGMTLQGSTVNTDNRNALVPPAMALVQNAMSGLQVAGQAANPWSHTVTTQQEMRQLFSVFPGGNLWGVRNVSDWLAQGRPRTELKQQQ